jgi:hypothetical protein
MRQRCSTPTEACPGRWLGPVLPDRAEIDVAAPPKQPFMVEGHHFVRSASRATCVRATGGVAHNLVELGGEVLIGKSAREDIGTGRAGSRDRIQGAHASSGNDSQFRRRDPACAGWQVAVMTLSPWTNKRQV